MYSIFDRVYLLRKQSNPLEIENPIPKNETIIDPREVFEKGLISLTVHLFTFLFSFIAIPISIFSIYVSNMDIE